MMFVVLAVVLSMCVVMSACSKKEGSDLKASSSSNAAANDPSSDPSNEPSSDPSKRETLSLFMSNSGVETPDSVNLSDNPFINVVKDYANVNLKVEVPPYQDFQTKFNLVMSSGNLPDIVHTYYRDVAETAAEQGAFLDLKKYYDNSPVVQQWITPEMMEFAKSKKGGGYFRIPMANDKTPQGMFNFVRYEFIKKYNDGKFPQSVDEYVDLLRRMKKADPESYPLTNRVVGEAGLGYAGNVLYYWYGALPHSYRVQDGKVLSTFVLPEYRAATELMHQMYEEGILDKEFATNNNDQYWQKLVNRNALLENNSAAELIWRGLTSAAAGGLLENKEFVIAPPLSQFPDVLKDPKYVLSPRNMPINDHGLYISAKTKNPDLAWKVIEGFATKDLFEAIYWGKEGSEYVIKDGGREPVLEKIQSEDRNWALQLALIPGFSAGGEIEKAQAKMKYNPEYFKAVYDSLDASQELMKTATLSLLNFFPPSDEINKKTGEKTAFIAKATVEAIMGNITMEQFDQRVQEFHQKFDFIYDDYTKFLTDNKEMLLENGVIEAGW
ncbi:extracellular solute-binding protein [Paenibacillus eucommiae]|nr:extracellular solute-binding protein [Paenibacillus eucommiae]